MGWQPPEPNAIALSGDPADTITGSNGDWDFGNSVWAALNGAVAGNVNLADFYNAQTMDNLTRAMDQIVRDNPEYGPEMALRWAHGLSVDNGNLPFVVYQAKQQFGTSAQFATDTVGVEDRVRRTDGKLTMSFNAPIPRTELGGMIIVFASVKPDETISSQPDPFLSEPWGLDNFAADELKLDPVPVTLRDLDSDIAAGSEATVAFYTGHNQLKAYYSSYGLSRQLDPSTVENQTAIWQLEVPLSVTPDNILYPADLGQYPFSDQWAEVCTCFATAVMRMPTPMIVGPTPVETLEIIDDEDIFETEE